MSTGFAKRKRAEADEGDHGRKYKQHKQFSRRPRPGKASEHRNPHARRGHPKSDAAKSEEEEAQKSINALKSRIRDLSRLLRHTDNDEKSRMPQGIRIERERELESCRHELEEKQTAQREAKFRSDIIGKYHMVRFFERQKATRTLKRLHKQLTVLEDESEKDSKMRSIHNAEVDLNYTLYYPLLKTYVSLYPKQQKDGDKSSDAASLPEGPKGDVEMWKRVEKAMEDHTLEELRESREGVTIPGAPTRTQLKTTKKAEKKDKQEYAKQKKTQDTRVAAGDQDEDEDSDEGFFA